MSHPEKRARPGGERDGDGNPGAGAKRFRPAGGVNGHAPHSSRSNSSHAIGNGASNAQPVVEEDTTDFPLLAFRRGPCALPDDLLAALPIRPLRYNLEIPINDAKALIEPGQLLKGNRMPLLCALVVVRGPSEARLVCALNSRTDSEWIFMAPLEWTKAYGYRISLDLHLLAPYPLPALRRHILPKLCEGAVPFHLSLQNSSLRLTFQTRGDLVTAQQNFDRWWKMPEPWQKHSADNWERAVDPRFVNKIVKGRDVAVLGGRTVGFPMGTGKAGACKGTTAAPPASSTSNSNSLPKTSDSKPHPAQKPHPAPQSIAQPAIPKSSHTHFPSSANTSSEPPQTAVRKLDDLGTPRKGKREDGSRRDSGIGVDLANPSKPLERPKKKGKWTERDVASSGEHPSSTPGNPDEQRKSGIPSYFDRVSNVKQGSRIDTRNPEIKEAGKLPKRAVDEIAAAAKPNHSHPVRSEPIKPRTTKDGAKRTVDTGPAAWSTARLPSDVAVASESVQATNPNPGKSRHSEFSEPPVGVKNFGLAFAEPSARVKLPKPPVELNDSAGHGSGSWGTFGIPKSESPIAPKLGKTGRWTEIERRTAEDPKQVKKPKVFEEPKPHVTAGSRMMKSSACLMIIPRVESVVELPASGSKLPRDPTISSEPSLSKPQNSATVPTSSFPKTLQGSHPSGEPKPVPAVPTLPPKPTSSQRPPSNPYIPPAAPIPTRSKLSQPITEFDPTVAQVVVLGGELKLVFQIPDDDAEMVVAEPSRSQRKSDVVVRDPICLDSDDDELRMREFGKSKAAEGAKKAAPKPVESGMVSTAEASWPKPLKRKRVDQPIEGVQERTEIAQNRDSREVDEPVVELEPQPQRTPQPPASSVVSSKPAVISPVRPGSGLPTPPRANSPTPEPPARLEAATEEQRISADIQKQLAELQARCDRFEQMREVERRLMSEERARLDADLAELQKKKEEMERRSLELDRVIQGSPAAGLATLHRERAALDKVILEYAKKHQAQVKQVNELKKQAQKELAEAEQQRAMLASMIHEQAQRALRVVPGEVVVIKDEPEEEISWA